MKNSQAWSFDIMLAVIIFIGTIFFFFAILNKAPGTKVDELEQDASRIIEDMVSDDFEFRVTDGDKVNVTKLGDLIGNYSDIKSKLKIENEFCIFFEDEDGNIIYINISENRNYTGIGSGIINVGGIPCS
ncbi:hypothetical protein CMO93_00395 [Candidatus Woesearchaeota archaeon]|nr:hypothetical protein [Candidatus Woesearchaeota archaeon]|tara:strand:+ start:1229 stop:1618 length:390 start_codon:yes stop_codon:yes gene_type:complete